jgi:superoxide reductase
MTPEHFIQWIEVKQSDKIQRVELNPQCKPMATFVVDTIEPIEVYEYCNLHGLWGNSANMVED